MFNYVIEQGHDAIVASILNRDIKRSSRTVIYTNSSVSKIIDALPPTSSVVHGHIGCAYFFVYNLVYNLVEEDRNESLNPLDYGCEEHSGALFPSKCIMRCHQTL